MIGDKIAKSTDSRHTGTYPLADIIGKTTLTFNLNGLFGVVDHSQRSYGDHGMHKQNLHPHLLSNPEEYRIRNPRLAEAAKKKTQVSLTWKVR